MNTHSSTIVPISTWSYSGIDLADSKELVDFGLMCEALIYYDHVYIEIQSPMVLAKLLSWFLKQNNGYIKLLGLLDSGILRILHYTYYPVVISNRIKDTHQYGNPPDWIKQHQIQVNPSEEFLDKFSLWNIQNVSIKYPTVFETAVLSQAPAYNFFKNRSRKKLYKALLKSTKEIIKNDGIYLDGFNNALLDIDDSRRQSVILQAYIDNLYKYKKIAHPPQVNADTQITSSVHQVSFDTDYDSLIKISGDKISFKREDPIYASAYCNRYISTAIDKRFDLYVNTPLNNLIGDKLYESEYKINRVKRIINSLNVEVEFPKIRDLINHQQKTLNNLLEIRKEATKFRSWLQAESDRDRNAIIAYHHEASNKLRLSKYGSKTLSMFGSILGAAGGAGIGQVFNEPIVGAGLGAASSGFLKFIADKISTEWKPVIFGEWLDRRIKTYLESSNNES